MAWIKWFPWRFIIRRVATSQGFLDPIALLSRLARFAQPSEVSEPIELLRAGVVFHARGLINSRVIQHNLDWVWPYWVERQFNPRDDAFIPRAFSITHVNLTHRNWTAVGLPDCNELPIVDPRGLLTPLLDHWSLDCWVMAESGEILLPSRATEARQRLILDDGVAVETEAAADNLHLITRAKVEAHATGAACRLELTATAPQGGWAVVTLRPYNPEGVSFLYQARLSQDRRHWTINGGQAVYFSEPVDAHRMSDYRAGDVFIHLRDRQETTDGRCEVGMLTAAALFRLAPATSRQLSLTIPLATGRYDLKTVPRMWQESLQGHSRLTIPIQQFQFLYDAAVHTLIMHSPEDVYPGPYTYKRFWFRDAAFIIHALLCAGLTARAKRALDRFPPRQTPFGFFYSQDGEWDANGEALWIMHRFCQMTNQPPDEKWWKAICPGAAWISRKRLHGKAGQSRHAGLLPAGFSAEHLGPNDFYYWDDFWGVAGLLGAAAMAARRGETETAAAFHAEANAFHQDIERSLEKVAIILRSRAIPASPYRRLDAGAIGSLAAGYPTMLFPPLDPRLLATVEFLLQNCLVAGGFFQDMIHSGINAYLTLHLAQVLLRAGDPRSLSLMRTVANLASPTGQWPEAIHPRTGGGCMGDGQHVWAAAEWLLMIRNCLVREEGERLLLASGLDQSWLPGNSELSFGPAPTSFGPVTLQVTATASSVAIAWQGEWHGAPPAVEIRLPGHPRVQARKEQHSITLQRGTRP